MISIACLTLTDMRPKNITRKGQPRFVAVTIEDHHVGQEYLPLGNGLSIRYAATSEDIGKTVNFNLNGGSIDLLYNTTP